MTTFGLNPYRTRLVDSQDPCAFSGSGLPLLLVSFLKRHCTLMVSADIVKILHLVDPDDPVLASECFVKNA